ncbi:MAG TPA: hypothetical protein P5110_03990 [Candidatus Omnitrophota bacterium]|nr:hypothetical protein [Candidatus Omnitrophota bacterium]
MDILGKCLMIAFLGMTMMIPARVYAQAIPYKGKADTIIARSNGNFQQIQQALTRAWDRTMQSNFDYNADGDFNDKDIEAFETAITNSLYNQKMDLNGDGKLDAADASLMRNLARFAALSRDAKAKTLQDLKVSAAATVILGLAKSGKGSEAATLLQLLDSQVVATILKDKQFNDQQVANLLGQFSAQKAKEVLGYFSTGKTARIMEKMGTFGVGQTGRDPGRDQVTAVLAQMLNAQDNDLKSKENAAAIFNAMETSRAVEVLKGLKSAEIADLVCFADAEKSATLLESIGTDAAAAVIESMSNKKQSLTILNTLKGDFSRQLIGVIGSGDMARILYHADNAAINAILARLEEDIARQIREELKKKDALF